MGLKSFDIVTFDFGSLIQSETGGLSLEISTFQLLCLLWSWHANLTCRKSGTGNLVIGLDLAVVPLLKAKGMLSNLKVPISHMLLVKCFNIYSLEEMMGATVAEW